MNSQLDRACSAFQTGQARTQELRGSCYRLSAQAASGADQIPRLGGVSNQLPNQPPKVVDSVQASIEAAKAIAARMSSGGGTNVLGGSQTNGSSGQWAWGRG